MPNIRQNLMYLFTYLRRLAVKRRGGVDVVTLVFSDKIDHDTLTTDRGFRCNFRW